MKIAFISDYMCSEVASLNKERISLISRARSIRRRPLEYLKKRTIQLTAIVALGAACFLTSCANQSSTAKRSSLLAGFVTANASAIYSDPKTDENIRKADDYWLPPDRARGEPYNRPR
jgi:hypothetical protein